MDLTRRDLEYIPKKVLLQQWGEDIPLLWHKLPAHIRADAEVATYMPCYRHYNLPTSRDHIDGPAPQIRLCRSCQNTTIEEEKD